MSVGWSAGDADSVGLSAGDADSVDALRRQLEALMQFLYLAPIGMIRFDADGRVDLINPMATQLLDPMAQRDPTDAFALLAPIAPDLAAQIAAFDADFGTVMKSRRGQIAGADAAPLVVSLTVQRKDATTFMAVVRDITHHVISERQVLQDAQRFRAIVEGVRDYAISVMDPEGRMTAWNPSIERIAGWRQGEIEGRHIREFFVADEGAPDSIDDLLAAARRGDRARLECWRLRRDGSRYWAGTTMTALRDETGEVWALVGIVRDLTERKRAEDELRRLATTDPLTGAFNRRHGHARLVDELQRRERYRIPVSVLIIDIDWFKSLNDRYGHEVGDNVLCSLVACCSATLRAGDVFIRWGGEEFLVLLPATAEAAALDAARRVQNAVADLRVTLDDGTAIGLTVSIGVAEAQDGSVACLINRADTALYAAKRAGRNRALVAGQEPSVAVSSLC